VVATAPLVVETAFAVISVAGVTTCGSAADSAARKNRFADTTTRALAYSGGPPTPAAMSTATSPTAKQRNTFAATSTRCRRHRSSSTPANGPTSEYGSSSTAKPAATSAGVAARSGLNSTAPARLAWNTPSEVWLASRVV